MKKALRLSLIAIIALLGACGFHLRGSGGSGFDNADPAWKQMALIAKPGNSELAQQLRTHFNAYGVNWVNPRAANYIVYLQPEHFDQRYLTLNTSARAAEYQLTLTTQYWVTNKNGEIIIPKNQGRTVRQMTSDPSNVLGKAEEVNILRREMRNQLVQQIIRRIEFYAAGQQKEKK